MRVTRVFDGDLLETTIKSPSGRPWEISIFLSDEVQHKLGMRAVGNRSKFSQLQGIEISAKVAKATDGGKT